MSILLSSVCKTAIKNAVLNRQIQSFARLATITHTTQINKIQDKLNASKFDAKLVKSFSADASNVAAHDHSRLWTLERGLSAVLIAAMPLAFIIPNPSLDYALAFSLVVHVHWGLEAIVVDYIRPRIFGPLIPKIAIALTYLISILACTGLFYFNYTDVGLSKAMQMYLKK